METNIDNIIANLTLEEKVSLLSGKTFWETTNIDKVGIPSIFLADGPHGIRKQMAASDHLGLNESYKATCFPTSAALANSWDEALAQEVGDALSNEARAMGVNVLLGPGLNIKRNPLCGRNFEYFSEDPYLAGKMAAACVRGIQSTGVSACLKHFAANNQEYRRMVSDSIIDERTLREIYLTGFEIVIKEGGAKCVMSAYNKLNGEYANENQHLMQEILRDSWGFDGVVVTDWGGSNDRVEGLKAGNELEMPTTDGETNREVQQAVLEGKLDEKVIDDALRRLLGLIYDSTQSSVESFDKQKHHELARRAAHSSMVLLKNEGSVLPLKEGANVAVIGDFAFTPRYQGAGSSIVNPTTIENTVEVIGKSRLNVVGCERGFKRFGSKSGKLLKRAVKLANKADVVLVYLGLSEEAETEGLDRPNMKLPQNQIELLKALYATNKKIVVVLSCGSSVETDWDIYTHGVLYSSLGGQASASAALDIILGKVNPSGRLAETFLKAYENSPSTPYFPGLEKTAQYREGLFVGYRGVDNRAGAKYPFGYGLSYTTFKYELGDIKEDRLIVNITNTGSAAGTETVQMYISANHSNIIRPLKELKGFKKVFLQAGEAKSVELLFNDYTFRFFNVAKNDWDIEAGDYTVMVGASAGDIRVEGTLTRQGSVIERDSNPLLAKYFHQNIDHIMPEEFEALYGRALPDSKTKFIKRKRLVVDYNTTVAELRFSRGWVGRFFAWGIRTAYKLLRFFGNHKMASTLMLGVFHQPMRGISRMSGGMISHGQLDGLLIMFNGKFFKGISKFIKEGKIKKKRRKAEKKEANSKAEKKEANTKKVG